METSALYMLAARYNVQALGVFTVSNHLFTGEETTAKEREQSFDYCESYTCDFNHELSERNSQRI